VPTSYEMKVKNAYLGVNLKSYYREKEELNLTL
jgi:hypothetical protein